MAVRFSIDFEPAKGKYASSYNLLSLNKVPKKLKANVSFLNDEDNPDEMMYSWRQIIRLHGKALQEFEKIYGKTYKK